MDLVKKERELEHPCNLGHIDDNVQDDDEEDEDDEGKE